MNRRIRSTAWLGLQRELTDAPLAVDMRLRRGPAASDDAEYECYDCPNGPEEKNTRHRGFELAVVPIR